jgi:hypothetical protein
VIRSQTNIKEKVRDSTQLIGTIGDLDILVLVPISTQRKGLECCMHVKISYIERPWGNLPDFPPFNFLVDHTFTI